MTTVHAGYLSPIYQRQIKLSREKRINAAFRGARIDKSFFVCDARNRHARWIRHGVVIWIKTYIDENSWANTDQQVAALAQRPIIESTFDFSHSETRYITEAGRVIGGAPT